MIDVFFCMADSRRFNIASECLIQGWINLNMDTDGTLKIDPITPIICKCSHLEFQRQRRIYSDQKSSNGVYIVADDDCLIPKQFNLAEALRVVEAHPEFSVISLLPSNAHISEWTPENYQTFNDQDVMEVESVGGIRFCRKGHMNEWPQMGNGPGYDLIHARQVRKQGKRVGYFRNHKMLHLGEGFSTVWNQETTNVG